MAQRNHDEREATSEGQQNLLPLDAARNEAKFIGSLIDGGPLSTVQRIGALIIGLPFLSLGIFGLYSLVHSPDDLVPEVSQHPIFYTGLSLLQNIFVIVILLVALGVGLRITKNALTSHRIK